MNELIGKKNLINDIASDYEKQLAIPTTKPKNKFILCPVGLVGSGKTTVVRPLSEMLFLVRISGDEIRRILKEKGYGYEKVRDIFELLAIKYLDLGYSLCVDSDCISPRTYRFLKNREAEGIKLAWIHINPPEEFILNKLRNFNHTWLFENADAAIDNYYRRKNLHEKLAMPFIYTFDTSKAGLPKQIDEGAEIIRKFTNN